MKLALVQTSQARADGPRNDLNTIASSTTIHQRLLFLMTRVEKSAFIDTDSTSPL
jgi:hypothetical protein